MDTLSQEGLKGTVTTAAEEAAEVGGPTEAGCVVRGVTKDAVVLRCTHTFSSRGEQGAPVLRTEIIP